MLKSVTKSALSPSRKTLVQLMQHINFGTIENLAIRNGEPVLDPLPRVIRDVKFRGQNGPRHETDLKDFALKGEVRALFEHLDRLGNGTIERLEVQHGLPFRMQLEEVTA
jgi:hypothetical protein